MTEVRIRHIDEINGASLGDVPFADLDTVIPTLKSWGVNISGDGLVNNDDLTGSFEYDTRTDEAFFEVLIEPAREDLP